MQPGLSLSKGRYYIHRRDVNKQAPHRPPKRIDYRRYDKLILIICCVSHAVLGAVASEGPTPDIDQFDRVMMEVKADVNISKS